MLLINEPGFSNVDSSDIPWFRSGNMEPLKDFGKTHLLEMPVGSFYVSVTYDVINCRKVITNAITYQKVKQTGGRCSTAGHCTDWVPLATGITICGTAPPVGSNSDFCCVPKGSFYVQIVRDTSGKCKTDTDGNPVIYIWMKVFNDCSSDDWVIVSPSTAPVFSGTDAPVPVDGDMLCSAPIGSWYMHELPSGCSIAYVKIKANCDACDWIAPGSLCVATGDGRPDGELFTDYPVGSTYYQTCGTNKIRWEKIANEGEDSDWVNTSITPTHKLADDAAFSHSTTAVCCLPVGGIVYQAVPRRAWVRIAGDSDNCAATDWMPIGRPTVYQGEALTDAPADIADGDIYIEAADTNCDRHWLRAEGANDDGYIELFKPKAIGLRYPASEPVQIIPKDILTPVALSTVSYDTTGTVTGTELELPCGGLWRISARLWFKHPLGVGPDSPADLGTLSPEATLALFVGRNGSNAYMREFSPAEYTNGYLLSLNVDRSEVLLAGDTFQLFALWEDSGSTDVLELEVTIGSIDAEFIASI